jgi:hypothetical protein
MGASMSDSLSDGRAPAWVVHDHWQWKRHQFCTHYVHSATGGGHVKSHRSCEADSAMLSTSALSLMEHLRVLC